MIGSMNLGFPEMVFLFLLALIIFGPKKMPEIGRQIGRALNEFKRASNEFKAQIETEINQLELNEHQILPPSPPMGSVPAYEPPPIVQAEAVPLPAENQQHALEAQNPGSESPETHNHEAQPLPSQPEHTALPEPSVVEGSNA